MNPERSSAGCHWSDPARADPHRPRARRVGLRHVVGGSPVEGQALSGAIAALQEASMKIVKNVHPPSGVSRALFRAPIYLYRLGLGWLFGKRILLLNHIGRVSGKQRQVIWKSLSTIPPTEASWSPPDGDPPPPGTATFFTHRRSASRSDDARSR